MPAAPVAAFLKTSSPAAPDLDDIVTRARIPSEKNLTRLQPATKLTRARAVPRLSTPPPSPPSHLIDVSLSDFATKSGTPWALQPTTGLRSLTIELSWSIWVPPGDAIWPVWDKREWADEAPMRERASAAEAGLVAVLDAGQEEDTWELSPNLQADVEQEIEEPLVARSEAATATPHDASRRHTRGSRGRYFGPAPRLSNDLEDPWEPRSIRDHFDGQNDYVPLVSSQGAAGVDELETAPPLVPQKRAHAFSQDDEQDGQVETMTKSAPETFVNPDSVSYFADQSNSPATVDTDARPPVEAAPVAFDLLPKSRQPGTTTRVPLPEVIATSKPLLNDQPQLDAPPPKTAWSSTSALSRFIGSRGRHAPTPVTKPQSARAPAPPQAAPHPVAPPPLPRPASLRFPDFLRESSTTAVEDETAHRIIASPDLLQMPAQFQALELQRFAILDRPHRYPPQPHRTLEPHLILDGKTCVFFGLLIKIVGNVCRPEELLPGSAAPTTRDEAVLTTLHRLAGQYDRVLLILEEASSNSSTRAFAYTPPILAALSSLESAIAEHLPPSCTIEVALSTNPEESAVMIRTLARHLKVLPAEESESWLFDEPTEVRFLSAMCFTAGVNSHFKM